MQPNLVSIQRKLANKETLTDEEVRVVAKLRHETNVGKEFVRVRKLALREGEELWDFVHVMCAAVQGDRVLLADGSLDVQLIGIYDDYVIVQDWNTGKLFKSTFTRGSDGIIVFSPPIEVHVEFTPVVPGDVQKSIPEEVLVLKAAPARKWSFLAGVLGGSK